MEKRIIAFSPNMKNGLDDDYTLYEDGTVIHDFDEHRYPGGYNLKRRLNAIDLKSDIKSRLINVTSEEDKELARTLLNL